MQQPGGQMWNGEHIFQIVGPGTTGPPAGDGPAPAAIAFAELSNAFIWSTHREGLYIVLNAARLHFSALPGRCMTTWEHACHSKVPCKLPLCEKWRKTMWRKIQLCSRSHPVRNLLLCFPPLHAFRDDGKTDITDGVLLRDSANARPCRITCHNKNSAHPYTVNSYLLMPQVLLQQRSWSSVTNGPFHCCFWRHQQQKTF